MVSMIRTFGSDFSEMTKWEPAAVETGQAEKTQEIHQRSWKYYKCPKQQFGSIITSKEATELNAFNDLWRQLWTVRRGFCRWSRTSAYSYVHTDNKTSKLWHLATSLRSVRRQGYPGNGSLRCCSISLSDMKQDFELPGNFSLTLGFILYSF